MAARTAVQEPMTGLTCRQPQPPPAPPAEKEEPAQAAGARFQAYIECHQREEELKRELAEVKARMEHLEAQAQREMDDLGTQSIRTRSGHTVYLQKELYASLIADKEKAHAALRRHGLDYLIKDNVNGQSLSAYVREQDREKDENNAAGLHPELQEVIRVSRRIRVRIRKS